MFLALRKSDNLFHKCEHSKKIFCESVTFLNLLPFMPFRDFQITFSLITKASHFLTNCFYSQSQALVNQVRIFCYIAHFRNLVIHISYFLRPKKNRSTTKIVLTASQNREMACSKWHFW